MANRIFAITVARETVTLDDQGRAQVSFTASNTGSKSLAGRAKLVPLGSTKESWLGLEGESERNFAKGESHQFTVKIATPPGTPAGKHTFRLNIISVENPDDDFTEGPSVSFEVKQSAPAAPPPRKFPWWIVAVAGVLLVGAGIITWLLMPEKSTVPELVGKPYEEAVKSLTTAKLKLGAKEGKTTGAQSAGTVLEQSPKAKEVVRAGTGVSLVVEVPAETTVEAALVQVPDVKGLTVGSVKG
jgi:serine/threonine-protein kinase